MDESFLSWLVEVHTYDNNYIYEKIFISESPQQLARLNKSSYMVVGLEPHMTRLSSTLPVPIQKTENLIYLRRKVRMVHIGNIWDKYSMHHHYTILLSYKRYKHT